MRREKKKVLIKETAKPESMTDPWALYLCAIKSAATKEKYLLRLRKFLDFLNLGDGKLETRARAFAHNAVNDSIWAFNCILGFTEFQKERFNRKEITAGTIRNYVKSIKLFCSMSDIAINWDKRV